MSITNSEKRNLERFGCTLRERTGVFLIDWKRKRAAQASNANIFACLGYVKTETGPIVLLAFEISSVRPLPSYCYFPFDFKKQAHRKYLSRFMESGEIRLSFLTDKRTWGRVHRLPPYLRGRASEIYAEMLQEWESIEPDKYNFGRALHSMERHVRIPEFVDRMLLEDSLREISEKIEAAVQAVPNENRELARGCVRQAAEAFLPHYRNNRKTFLENLHRTRLGSTYVLDLHRMFADNPAGLTKFLSDGLAASFSQKELVGLNELVKLVVSLSKLPFKEESSTATESMPTIPEPPTGLAALVQLMAASGISKDSASRFLELIGLDVGGRPGRPAKDYSREYDLKMSGSSWTQVARCALAEREELQAELGSRDFDSLNHSDQDRLWNRIRQGVINYARRSNKPLPSEAELSESSLLERRKKITEK